MPARKIANAQGGSDARYHVGPGSGVNKVGDIYVDDQGNQYDADGRPLGANAPGQNEWDPNLPGARESESYDPWSGQTGRPGGPGGPGGGPAPGGLGAGYSQFQSLLQAQSAADRANTVKGIQQALISFGLVPEGFQDKLGALDEVTRGLIQKNTQSGISAYARMLEQKQDSIQDLVKRLSSRGLRRSGARGYKLRRGQLDWDRQKADALAQLLGYTGGLYSQFSGNEFGRQSALMNAFQNFYQPSFQNFSQPTRSVDGRQLPNTVNQTNPNAIRAAQGSIIRTPIGGGGSFIPV